GWALSRLDVGNVADRAVRLAARDLRQAARVQLAAEPQDVERGHRPVEALEAELADRFCIHQVLDRRQQPLRDKDLPRSGLSTQTGREVGHGADGAIIY